MVAKKDADFIGALLLFQHRRDNAIGLRHLTARQRGLIWFYRNLTRKKYIDALAAKVATEGIQARMKEIMSEITEAAEGEQKQLLAEAVRLEEMAHQWLI